MSPAAAYLRRLGLPADLPQTLETSYDEWHTALGDQLRVPLEHVDTRRLRVLRERTRVAHEAWTSAGRP